MANWAYVENGYVIESYDILPDNWRNISNFSVLKNNVDYLRSLNWLPIKQVNYSYNRATQQLDNRKFIVNNDEVIEMYDIVNIPAPPPIDIEKIKKMLASKVQDRLDSFARTRGYFDILTACSYVNDLHNSVYQKEASYCLKVRSQTWEKFYEIMSTLNFRDIPIQELYLEFETLLPLLEWPE